MAKIGAPRRPKLRGSRLFGDYHPTPKTLCVTDMGLGSLLYPLLPAGLAVTPLYRQILEIYTLFSNLELQILHASLQLHYYTRG
jgi:hypothetical protein